MKKVGCEYESHDDKHCKEQARNCNVYNCGSDNVYHHGSHTQIYN